MGIFNWYLPQFYPPENLHERGLYLIEVKATDLPKLTANGLFRSGLSAFNSEPRRCCEGAEARLGQWPVPVASGQPHIKLDYLTPTPEAGVLIQRGDKRLGTQPLVEFRIPNLKCLWK